MLEEVFEDFRLCFDLYQVNLLEAFVDLNLDFFLPFNYLLQFDNRLHPKTVPCICQLVELSLNG